MEWSPDLEGGGQQTYLTVRREGRRQDEQIRRRVRNADSTCAIGSHPPGSRTLVVKNLEAMNSHHETQDSRLGGVAPWQQTTRFRSCPRKLEVSFLRPASCFDAHYGSFEKGLTSWASHLSSRQEGLFVLPTCAKPRVQRAACRTAEPWVDGSAKTIESRQGGHEYRENAVVCKSPIPDLGNTPSNLESRMIYHIEHGRDGIR